MKTNNKNKSPEVRSVEFAEMIINNKMTVRQVASITGYGKSTVHKDIVNVLPKVSKLLFAKVNEVLQYNKDVRTIRGGEATRKKWESKRNEPSYA